MAIVIEADAHYIRGYDGSYPTTESGCSPFKLDGPVGQSDRAVFCDLEDDTSLARGVVIGVCVSLAAYLLIFSIPIVLRLTGAI